MWRQHVANYIDEIIVVDCCLMNGTGEIHQQSPLAITRQTDAGRCNKRVISLCQCLLDVVVK